MKNDYKNFSNLLEDVQNYFEEIFPIVIDGISEMENESYFDLTSKSYIPLGKEPNKNDRLENRYLPGDVNIASMYFLEGKVNIPNQASDGIYRKDMIYRPVARIDGKKICNTLREYRFKLAQMNNIEFNSEECSYVGACAGTCEKCDEEAKYLSMKLSEIPKEKQRIPRLGLEEVE